MANPDEVSASYWTKACRKLNGAPWVVRVCVWLSFVACERDGQPECPPEASVEVVAGEWRFDTTTRKTCRWADRETTIETDSRGGIVLRRSLVDGQLDGLQIESDWNYDLRTESNYRHGLLHGHQRRFTGNKLVGECLFIEGAQDGTCWNDNPRFGASVEHYDRGKRTGFWTYEFGHTRIYGDDILLAFGGEPVPLPPASLEVFGEVVTRSSCPQQPSDPCSSLFDKVQLCELGSANRVLCQLRAMEQYKRAGRIRAHRGGSPN